MILDTEISDYLAGSTAVYQWLRDQEELERVPDFKTEFREWLGLSAYNDVWGLDAFPYVYFTHGALHGSMILNLANAQRRESELGLVITALDPTTGRISPHLHDSNPTVVRYVDVRHFGVCVGLELDLRRPEIEAVSFSTDLALCAQAYPAGIVMSRRPIFGINDPDVSLNARIGVHLLRAFGPDFLIHKYRNSYQTVCDKRGLETTQILGLGWDGTRTVNIWDDIFRERDELLES